MVEELKNKNIGLPKIEVNHKMQVNKYEFS